MIIFIIICSRRKLYTIYFVTVLYIFVHYNIILMKIIVNYVVIIIIITYSHGITALALFINQSMRIKAIKKNEINPFTSSIIDGTAIELQMR